MKGIFILLLGFMQKNNSEFKNEKLNKEN